MSIRVLNLRSISWLLSVKGGVHGIRLMIETTGYYEAWRLQALSLLLCEALRT